MKTALITGVTGQDGSYLAEFLLARGYRVRGTSRDSSKASQRLPSPLISRIELLTLDVGDPHAVRAAVAESKPDEVYNCAGASSGAGMFEDPLGLARINGLAVVGMLEAIRLEHPQARFCQSSSREVFGLPDESPQSECTRVRPRNPYGAAKAYADSMVRIYREAFGLYACSAVLFNHESPRRPAEFVTRKITAAAARIKLGITDRLRLGSLDARRDWGFAGDFVEAQWRMLQRPAPLDYVIATGRSHSVREFCERAFAHLGLDYRRHIEEDPSLARAAESVLLVGDATKAGEDLGWKPRVSFQELVAMMVEADVQRLSDVTQGGRHVDA